MSPADRRYDRRTFLALAGAGAAVACLGSTEAPSPSPPAVTESPSPSPSPRAAALTGTLVVYSALEENTTNELLAAFAKADPGVRMDLAALAAADELETRLRVEQKARKADLWWAARAPITTRSGRTRSSTRTSLQRRPSSRRR